MHWPVALVHFLIEMTMTGVIAGMIVAVVWVYPRLRARSPLLPPAPPPVAPWGAVAVLAAWLLYFALGSLMGPLVATAADPIAPVAAAPQVDAKAPPPHHFSFTAQMLASTVVNAMAIVALPAVVLSLSGGRVSDLGLSRKRLGANIKAGAVAFLLVTPWVYLVFYLARQVISGEEHPVEKMVLQESSTLGIVLAVVSPVIFAPLAEEILFRGIMQSWLNRAARYGRIPASADSPGPGDVPESPGGQRLPRTEIWLPVVSSALVFAAVHAAVMPTPFPLFVLGLALGYLYQRTGSLVGPIVLHACFNGFASLRLLDVVTR